MRLLLQLFCCVTLASAYQHTILLLHYDNTSRLDLAFEAAITKSADIINNSAVTYQGVKCLIPDEESNPRHVTNAVCDCLESTTASGIIGPYTSDQTLVVAYLAATLKVPVISPSATAGILLDRGDWTSTLYRLTPNNHEQAEAIADLIMYFGWTRAVVIYTTDIYGMSLALYTMQACKIRDITIATTAVLKTGSSRDQINNILKEHLVPFEPKLILLLVPRSETDAIVSEASELELINSETVWIVGDGPTYFMDSATGFTKGMYKGMLGITHYVDTVSQDMLDLQDTYNSSGKTFDSKCPGVYYSTILLAKALQNINTPPTAKGCNSEWSTGGEQAIKELNKAFYYSTLPDNKTGYNVSFGDTGVIKDSRYSVMNYNGKRLVQVGKWYNNTISLLKSDVKWFGVSEPDHTANTIKASLKLGVNRDPPFLIYKRDNNVNCSGNDCYEGFSVDVVNLLKEQLGFEYEFVESNDGKFGAVDKNGTWNGLVRMLIDKEIDIATVGFGTSSRRESVIDFSANMLDGGVYILAKVHQEESSKLFFLQPFATEVWYGLLIGCAVVMLFVWFMDRFSVTAKEAKDEREKKLKDDPSDGDDEEINDNISAAETIWLVFCSFLGTIREAPHSWPSRIVVTGWWVICLVMINTYIADLAAYLTVSRMKTGYTSIEAIMQDKTITWGTVDSSVTQVLLENSNVKKYKDLISKAKNVDSFEEAVAKVREGNFLMLYGRGPLEYAAGTEPCDTEMLNIPLAMFGYAFAFPQNSPYRDVLNRELFKLQEAGATMDLWDKWAKSGCGDNAPNINQEYESVTVKNLYDLMYVFVPLVVLAILLFIGEWITYRIRKKVKEGKNRN